jgi:hypothetical protein
VGASKWDKVVCGLWAPLRAGPFLCEVMFSIGTKVRFIKPFRPEAVEPGVVGIIVEIEPLPAVIWASSKAQSQVLQLYLDMAHPRSVGGSGLRPGHVGAGHRPYSAAISPPSDSTGRFSCDKRNHRSASTVYNRLMRTSSALRASLMHSSARQRNHIALGCSSVTNSPAGFPTRSAPCHRRPR